MILDPIVFSIIEYEERTYRVETKNKKYHFKDGYYFDCLRSDDLIYTMEIITSTCNNLGIAVLFEVA